MPTILESLLFEIGIDTKKLGGDAKEAEQHLQGVENRSGKVIKDLEERGGKSTALFKGLKEEAAGFLSIVAGAFTASKMAEWSKQTMLQAESLGFMSERMGIATTRLKAWQLAAEKNGGTAAGITGFIRQATVASTRGPLGFDFPGDKMFFNLGGTSADLQTPESYMMALSRMIKKQYATSPALGLFSAQELSVPEELIPLLLKENLSSVVKDQERYAKGLGELSVEANEALNSFRDVKNTFSLIGHILVQDVNPNLRETADYFKSIAENTEGLKKGVHESEALGGSAAKGAIATTLTSRLLGAGAAASLAIGAPLAAAWAVLTTPSELMTDEKAREINEKQIKNLDTYRKKIRQKEIDENIPTGTLDSMYLQESSRGTNPAMGAGGGWQITSGTLKLYQKQGFDWRSEDRLDPDKSLDMASRILVDNYNRLGSWDAAIAAYNDGDPNTPKAQNYLRAIQGHINRGEAGNYNDLNGKTDVHVNGEVHIHTESKDPEGIKKEFAEKMSSYSKSAQLSETGTY